VLLQRPYYESRLRPLLTHWALLWLCRNRVQLLAVSVVYCGSAGHHGHVH
jgi:hypothetical protein